MLLQYVTVECGGALSVEDPTAAVTSNPLLSRSIRTEWGSKKETGGGEAEALLPRFYHVGLI